MAHAADTEVLSIKAGDTIEVAHTRFGPDRWEDEVFNDCPNGRGSCDWFKSDVSTLLFPLDTDRAI